MKRNLETICIHGGWKPSKGEPQQLPIYQSTTFKYETSEQMARLFDLEDSGYFYTRLANPTNDAVAKKIAALEGGVGAVLTSSGQAANFYAIINLCGAGDHFVTTNNIYGGTFNLFGVTLKKLGIECTFIDQNGMMIRLKLLSSQIQNVFLVKLYQILGVKSLISNALQELHINMVCH